MVINYSLNEIIVENKEINGISNIHGRQCELWKYVIVLFWKMSYVTNFQN